MSYSLRTGNGLSEYRTQSELQGLIRQSMMRARQSSPRVVPADSSSRDPPPSDDFRVGDESIEDLHRLLFQTNKDTTPKASRAQSTPRSRRPPMPEEASAAPSKPSREQQNHEYEDKTDQSVQLRLRIKQSIERARQTPTSRKFIVHTPVAQSFHEEATTSPRAIDYDSSFSSSQDSDATDRYSIVENKEVLSPVAQNKSPSRQQPQMFTFHDQAPTPRQQDTTLKTSDSESHPVVLIETDSSDESGVEVVEQREPLSTRSRQSVRSEYARPPSSAKNIFRQHPPLPKLPPRYQHHTNHEDQVEQSRNSPKHSSPEHKHHSPKQETREESQESQEQPNSIQVEMHSPKSMYEDENQKNRDQQVLVSSRENTVELHPEQSVIGTSPRKQEQSPSMALNFSHFYNGPSQNYQQTDRLVRTLSLSPRSQANAFKLPNAEPLNEEEIEKMRPLWLNKSKSKSIDVPGERHIPNQSTLDPDESVVSMNEKEQADNKEESSKDQDSPADEGIERPLSTKSNGTKPLVKMIEVPNEVILQTKFQNMLEQPEDFLCYPSTTFETKDDTVLEHKRRQMRMLMAGNPRKTAKPRRQSRRRNQSAPRSTSTRKSEAVITNDLLREIALRRGGKINTEELARLLEKTERKRAARIQKLSLQLSKQEEEIGSGCCAVLIGCLTCGMTNNNEDEASLPSLMTGYSATDVDDASRLQYTDGSFSTWREDDNTIESDWA